MTPRQTRTQRLAMPLARHAVRDLVISHGGRIRPIQLRRTDLHTGQTEQILVPSGPGPCGRRNAGRAGTSTPSPSLPPAPPTTSSGCGWSTAPRPSSSTTTPRQQDRDTGELDELAAELDEEITRSGMRG